jgi:hypothetical protein
MAKLHCNIGLFTSAFLTLKSLIVPVFSVSVRSTACPGEPSHNEITHCSFCSVFLGGELNALANLFTLKSFIDPVFGVSVRRTDAQANLLTL